LYAWLFAGLLTLGLGAAIVAGASAAAADTGSTAGNGSATSNSGSTGAKHGVGSSRRAPAAAKSSAVSTKAAGRSTRTGSVTPSSAAVTTGAATAGLTPWDSFLRQVRYIFANKPPTIDQGTQTEGAGGVVDGTVISKSNNGFALKYTLGTGPSYGTVVVNAATGGYTYTPNADVPDSAMVDEFTIVADNGSNARLPGPAGALQNVLRSIAVSLGASGPTTADTTIYVGVENPDLPEIIGDPTVTKQYWVSDGPPTSGLAAVVMAVGQLTGTLPELQAWIDRAKVTDSVQRQLFVNGKATAQYRKMYLDNGTDWVWTADALQLLSTSGDGISVSTTYLPRSKGDTALINMASALTDGSAVMVSINSKIGSDTSPTNHAVVVLGINTRTDQVYLNDAAQGASGQNMTMSIADFMAGWDPNYPLIVAKRSLADAARQSLTQADLALAA
jgi:hypothetical protein